MTKTTKMALKANWAYSYKYKSVQEPNQIESHITERKLKEIYDISPNNLRHN